MIELLRKNLDLLVVAVLVLSLVMYDVTIELVLELLHLGFEVVHNLYEWVELGIEHLVEHLFHTDRHGSQIITFYILVTIGMTIIWRLWKLAPGYYLAGKELAEELWTRRKSQLQLYWLSLTTSHKVAMAITAVFVAYLASFFVI